MLEGDAVRPDADELDGAVSEHPRFASEAGDDAVALGDDVTLGLQPLLEARS